MRPSAQAGRGHRGGNRRRPSVVGRRTGGPAGRSTSRRPWLIAAGVVGVLALGAGVGAIVVAVSNSGGSKKPNHTVAAGRTSGSAPVTSPRPTPGPSPTSIAQDSGGVVRIETVSCDRPGRRYGFPAVADIGRHRQSRRRPVLGDQSRDRRAAYVGDGHRHRRQPRPRPRPRGQAADRASIHLVAHDTRRRFPGRRNRISDR